MGRSLDLGHLARCGRLGITMIAAVALVGLTACAGGWRNGAAPGATAGSAASSATTSMAGGGASASTPAAAATSAGGAKFVWTGEGSSVNVAGEFNAWNTSSDPLVKQADGTWVLVKKLEPGRYPYKFVIDGTNWKPDPNATETVDDGFGGKNSVVVVLGGASPITAEQIKELPVQTLGDVVPGGDKISRSPSTAPPGKGAAPRIAADGVTFTFAGAAKSVNIAGDFNAWSTSTDPLVHQADGTWTITKKLTAGTYSYKFVVDGTTWKQDESNMQSNDDGFGGKNSVITVP